MAYRGSSDGNGLSIINKFGICDMSHAQKLYEVALNEINKNDPNIETVINNLTEASELGNSKAIYALATWYLFGEHVEQDLHKAVFF